MQLTVAIPTYNRGPFLEETLQTLLPQLRAGMEIVISDNGSTDDTLKRLKPYQEKYPLRVVGFSHNEGIDRNIVHVLEHSRGDYVHLFGDDDLLMLGSIDSILEAIHEHQPLLICLNHFAFHNHSLKNRQPPFLSSQRKIFHDGGAFFKYCGLGFLSSLIIQREAVQPFLHKVRFCKECAHLDITSRIALQRQGVYLFMGDVCVAGRSLVKARYDLIHSCVIYIKQLYDELLQEGAMDRALYRYFTHKLLYREIPRIFYKHLQSSEETVFPFSLLREYFAQHQVLFFLLEKTHKKFLKRVFGCVSWGIRCYRCLIIVLRTSAGQKFPP